MQNYFSYMLPQKSPPTYNEAVEVLVVDENKLVCTKSNELTQLPCPSTGPPFSPQPLNSQSATRESYPRQGGNAGYSQQTGTYIVPYKNQQNGKFCFHVLVMYVF